MLDDNPHINFVDDRKRGYSLVDVTPQRWTLQMKEMSSVYTPNASAMTRKTYIVESGIAAAQEA